MDVVDLFNLVDIFRHFKAGGTFTKLPTPKAHPAKSGRSKRARSSSTEESSASAPKKVKLAQSSLSSFVIKSDAPLTKL